MSFKNPSQYALNTLNSNISNFNSAFIPNTTFIPQRDTKNYGNLIHNNVNNNLLNEIITEYTIHIDGKDRDTTKYPNPYSFSISLGGIDVPNPRIDVNFKNIKYIKLKYILLPRIIRYNVSISDGNKSYEIPVITDKRTILSNYRYLILRVKEISQDKLYSSNNTIRNDSFILYRDSNYDGALNDLWFATQPVKIYYDNNLKNLSKLTVQILTPNGDELKLLSNNSSTVSPIPYIEINEDNSSKTPSSDFYTEFNQNGDVNMSIEFEIGVCENQINTEKNYR